MKHDAGQLSKDEQATKEAWKCGRLINVEFHWNPEDCQT